MEMDTTIKSDGGKTNASSTLHSKTHAARGAGLRVTAQVGLATCSTLAIHQPNFQTDSERLPVHAHCHGRILARTGASGARELAVAGCTYCAQSPQAP